MTSWNGSPEWSTRSKYQDVLTGLDVVANLVATSAVPVPTAALAGFLGGVAGVMQLLDELRDVLPVGMWPETEVCTFLRARNALVKGADGCEAVCDTFTALGSSAGSLATALRALSPALDAAVEKARTALSTEHLLADDEDRRFERHRRILEASIGRQLDVLAKVRAVAKPATSGSFERAPQVELRVVRG